MSLVVGTLLACGTVREDEFICENAVSHLHECCSGFSVTIDCSFNQGCEDSTFPEIDSVQGDCILHESCDALRQTGVCDRAARLPNMGLQADSASPSVCTGPQETDAAPPDAAVVPAIGCASAADCDQGSVCCVQSVGIGVSFTCQSGSCASGFQACATSFECEPDRVCEPFNRSGSFANLKVCTAVDASGDDVEDATSDAPPVAPDAANAESRVDAASSEAGPASSDGSAADAQSDGATP